jgi:hypothetical protein
MTMTTFAVLIVVGTLIAVGVLVWAKGARDRREAPGPIDVTDRHVTPPAPGTSEALDADVAGSRRRRGEHGKP